MTKPIKDWVKGIKRKFNLNPGRTLEIGSRNINGSIREYFSDASEYIGIDLQYGPNVDMILDAHDSLKIFGPNSFDTVISCEVMEHDLEFWKTIENVKKILRPGGTFIATTPNFGFIGSEEEHPQDYWRAGPKAFEDFIFKGLIIGEVSVIAGEYEDRMSVVGIAFKDKHEEDKVRVVDIIS